MIDIHSYIFLESMMDPVQKKKEQELFVVKPESIITNDIFEKIIIVCFFSASSLRIFSFYDIFKYDLYITSIYL